MKPVILGKNLISDYELMVHNHENKDKHPHSIQDLRNIALQSALISSMAIIKMTRPGIFAEISAQSNKI